LIVFVCLLPSVSGLRVASSTHIHSERANENWTSLQASKLHLVNPPSSGPAGSLGIQSVLPHPSALKRSSPRHELEVLPQSDTRPEPAAMLQLAGMASAKLNLSGTLDCVENNGGTCAFQNCYAWRGAAQTCHLARCFCTGGLCAGTDGKCHEERNELIGHRVLLRNVRWPEYYISTSHFGTELWVDWNAGRQAEFELWRLPSGGYASDPPDFMLTSSMYQNWAVRVRETQSDQTSSSSSSSSSTSSSSSSSIRYKPILEHTTFPMETGIQHLALNIERIPERPEAVMISSFMYPREYLYIPRMSFTLDTYHNDPGTGAYWVFDPPLPNETMDRIRIYHGPRCTWLCGLSRGLFPSRAMLWLSMLPMLFLH